jgi:uncharacterized protein YraI
MLATTIRKVGLGTRRKAALAMLASLALAVTGVIGYSAPAYASGTGQIIIQPCLNLRQGPSGQSALIGCVPYHTTITIDCTATGNVVHGPYGPTTLWDHTTYQDYEGYVSDAYVYTGQSGPVAGQCDPYTGQNPARCANPTTWGSRTFNVAGDKVLLELRHSYSCVAGWARIGVPQGNGPALAVIVTAWNPGGISQTVVPGEPYTYTVDASPGYQVCGGFQAWSVDILGHKHYVGWFHACYTA